MRCHAIEYLGTNKARFECPRGHKFTAVVIPQRVRRARTWSDDACRMLVRYWRKDNGGVSMDCPRCKTHEPR